MPLHLYLDSADRGTLARCLPHPLVYGVTTNPSLMRQAGLAWAQLPGFVSFALERGARAVQVQVRSREAEAMLQDARRYAAWAEPGRVVVKLPATGDGLRAAGALREEGVAVTVTAVYGVEQALWAALVGARYAAPYLGRLDDRGVDGLERIRRMQAVLERAEVPTRLLVASLRSGAAVTAVLELGARAVTLPPALFLELLARPETLEAERAFLADARLVE